jgi:uncharacterized membrane protein YeiH
MVARMMHPADNPWIARLHKSSCNSKGAVDKNNQHRTPGSDLHNRLPNGWKTMIGTGLAFLVRFEHRAWKVMFPYVDALALGCWAAVGAQVALLSGSSWLPSLLLGVVTAVGGGVIRDLAVGQRPSIFGGNTLYATCALLASGLAVAGTTTGHPQVGAMVGTGVGAAACLLARWRGWMLPEAVEWRPSTNTWFVRRQKRQG